MSYDRIGMKILVVLFALAVITGIIALIIAFPSKVMAGSSTSRFSGALDKSRKFKNSKGRPCSANVISGNFPFDLVAIKSFLIVFNQVTEYHVTILWNCPIAEKVI